MKKINVFNLSKTKFRKQKELIKLFCFGLILTQLILLNSCNKYSDNKNSIRWHSYNLDISNQYSYGKVQTESGGLSAEVIFYISRNEKGVHFGHLLSHHEESFAWAAMGKTWRPGNRDHEKDVAPFAGNSSQARGENELEIQGEIPEPLGVFDLKMHPPTHDHMTVAAFIAPVEGYYTVQNLAVRKDAIQSDCVSYQVFNNKEEKVHEIFSSTDGKWKMSDANLKIGYLKKNESIYFAVHRCQRWAIDKAVLNWTITCIVSESGDRQVSGKTENQKLIKIEIPSGKLVSEEDDVTIMLINDKSEIIINNKSIAAISYRQKQGFSIQFLDEAYSLSLYNVARQKLFSIEKIIKEQQRFVFDYLANGYYYISIMKE